MNYKCDEEPIEQEIEPVDSLTTYLYLVIIGLIITGVIMIFK